MYLKALGDRKLGKALAHNDAGELERANERAVAAFMERRARYLIYP
jgi:hypothetical protein